jgi:predicted dehydrogenase
MDGAAPLRVGLVGCGNHGRNLAEAVHRLDSMQLVACADPDEGAARRAATRAEGATCHPSLDLLVAETPVDAVVVATPHHLLAPLSLTALRHGKHVMAEKPIGLDEAQAAEIDSVAGDAGLCFMSGYSFRFSMARHVKNLLETGAVGEVRAITGSIGCGAMDTGWRADPATGGGPMLYVGSHLVDMVLWFLHDDPLEVVAHVETRPDTAAEATAAFQMRFEGGAVGQCLVTQASAGFAYDLRVHGTEGFVALRGYSFLQFDVEVVSDAVSAYREPTVIRPFSGPDNTDMMLMPELDEFAAAIREARPPSVTADDGRRVLRVIDAVRRSARQGRPVPVA